jgi:4-hydroxybenzoate polyprenyltransferase
MLEMLITVIIFAILIGVAATILWLLFSEARMQCKRNGFVACLLFMAAVALLIVAVWPPFAMSAGFYAGIAIGLSETWACFTAVSAFFGTLTAACWLLDYSTR